MVSIALLPTKILKEKTLSLGSRWEQQSENKWCQVNIWLKRRQRSSRSAT